MRTIDDVIKSYKRVNFIIPYVPSFLPFIVGREQMIETKAIESILKSRGIKFEKIKEEMREKKKMRCGKCTYSISNEDKMLEHMSKIHGIKFGE